MTQFTKQAPDLFDNIRPNVSVLPEDMERLGDQARTIYALLRQGPVTTGQLSAIACQYNARIFEIRQALEGTGWQVNLIERGENGNNLYALQRVA